RALPLMSRIHPRFHRRAEMASTNNASRCVAAWSFAKRFRSDPKYRPRTKVPADTRGCDFGATREAAMAAFAKSWRREYRRPDTLITLRQACFAWVPP